ncbi:MAG: acyltransferase [Planctomycetes bacterium]|nr:acyltransferase [Planctomycetota bacterium]
MTTTDTTTPLPDLAAAPRPRRASFVHLPALDGLRGLAILMVMIFHQTILKPTGTLDRLFHGAVLPGGAGVDLFFVLSGFLITGILLDDKGARHYFLNFYGRRTVRIFPLYYAVVFVSLVVLPHFMPWVAERFASPRAAEVIHKKVMRFGSADQYALWFWFYMSNYAIAATGDFLHGILGVTWSLAIEEQFYLVWPMVVWVCSPRALARICIGMVVVALSVRIMLIAMHVGPIAVSVLTICRMDTLAIGALIAVMARRGGGLAACLPTAKWVAPLLGAISLVVIYNNRQQWIAGPITLTVSLSLNPIAFGGLLILAAAGPPAGLIVRFFNLRFMRLLGKLSYALYLFHLPLRAVVRDLILPGGELPRVGGSAIPAQLVFYVICTTATLAIAWVSWHVYEKQFLTLKRFFPRT